MPEKTKQLEDAILRLEQEIAQCNDPLVKIRLLFEQQKLLIQLHYEGTRLHRHY